MSNNMKFMGNSQQCDIKKIRKLRFESQQILRENNNLDLDAYIPLMDDFKKFSMKTFEFGDNGVFDQNPIEGQDDLEDNMKWSFKSQYQYIEKYLKQKEGQNYKPNIDRILKILKSYPQFQCDLISEQVIDHFQQKSQSGWNYLANHLLNNSSGIYDKIHKLNQFDQEKQQQEFQKKKLKQKHGSMLEDQITQKIDGSPKKHATLNSFLDKDDLSKSVSKNFEKEQSKFKSIQVNNNYDQLTEQREKENKISQKNYQIKNTENDNAFQKLKNDLIDVREINLNKQCKRKTQRNNSKRIIAQSKQEHYVPKNEDLILQKKFINKRKQIKKDLIIDQIQSNRQNEYYFRSQNGQLVENKSLKQKQLIPHIIFETNQLFKAFPQVDIQSLILEILNRQILQSQKLNELFWSNQLIVNLVNSKNEDEFNLRKNYYQQLNQISSKSEYQQLMLDPIDFNQIGQQILGPYQSWDNQNPLKIAIFLKISQIITQQSQDEVQNFKNIQTKQTEIKFSKLKQKKSINYRDESRNESRLTDDKQRKHLVYSSNILKRQSTSQNPIRLQNSKLEKNMDGIIKLRQSQSIGVSAITAPQTFRNNYLNNCNNSILDLN